MFGCSSLVNFFGSKGSGRCKSKLWSHRESAKPSTDHASQADHLGIRSTKDHGRPPEIFLPRMPHDIKLNSSDGGDGESRNGCTLCKSLRTAPVWASIALHRSTRPPGPESCTKRGRYLSAVHGLPSRILGPSRTF